MRLHEITSKKKIHEAVQTIPVKKEDFELLEALLEYPIEASMALSLIGPVLSDDGLNDTILAEAERDSTADVRAIIVQWMELNMPQQLMDVKADLRMGGNEGAFSPIHGEDVGKI